MHRFVSLYLVLSANAQEMRSWVWKESVYFLNDSKGRGSGVRKT